MSAPVLVPDEVTKLILHAFHHQLNVEQIVVGRPDNMTSVVSSRQKEEKLLYLGRIRAHR
jgi:hypothetical protein